MTFDVFTLLAQPGQPVAIHNVRLVDVQPADNGRERLIVEYAGTTHELIGGGSWNEKYSRQSVGQFGYAETATSWGDHELPLGACYFRGYVDQSLRRVPELDCPAVAPLESDGRMAEVVGWRCDSRPAGFRAPVGLIPGKDGQFVPDQTVAVTVRVPPEFVRECHRVQMSPADVLRSFVGDLAGVQSYVVCPRADRYGSNGSDERDYAEAWLQRAHGMNAIDLDAVEARECAAEEAQAQRDDFAALLDEFENYGGKPEELIAEVETLVKKQAQKE